MAAKHRLNCLRSLLALRQVNSIAQILKNAPYLLVAAIFLTGCGQERSDAPARASPQSAFVDRLSALCGKAFSGRLVSQDAADDDFKGKPMMMHVARCDEGELHIPFHVGAEKDGEWNRSRTWILTRTADGIRLKHRHRHEDGTLDTVTNYGGDTASEGSAKRQEFPVDAESIALFKANKLEQSVTNIWAMEIDKDRFAYELRRPKEAGGRFFRVEFDLSKPVKVPPPAWDEE